MGYKSALRGGIIFTASGIAGVLLLSWYLTIANPDKLLNQPIQVGVNRMVTNTFRVPSNATYAINIEVRGTVPYAGCLLGQSGSFEGERCDLHLRVLNSIWRLHAKDGGILRSGTTSGICCDYTTDDNVPVVISTLGYFSVPAGTVAYVELVQRHEMSPLRDLAPRLIVEFDDATWPGLGMDLAAQLGIALLLLIGLTQLILGSAIFLASRWRSRTH